MPITFSSPITIVNDSGHNSIPGFVIFPNGKFLVSYRFATTRVSAMMVMLGVIRHGD